MKRERLERLMAAVEASPDEAIDLNRWESPCGTLHCALGLACTIPEFRAEGLKLVEVPCFGDELDFGAGADFFGLTYGQAVALFCSRDPGVPGAGEYNSGSPTTDRQLWLSRARELLLTGEITE